jgi:hypothetical protein
MKLRFSSSDKKIYLCLFDLYNNLNRLFYFVFYLITSLLLFLLSINFYIFDFFLSFANSFVSCSDLLPSFLTAFRNSEEYCHMIEYLNTISVVSRASAFSGKKSAPASHFSPASLTQTASVVFSPSTLSLYFSAAESSGSSVILNGSGNYLEFLNKI